MAHFAQLDENNKVLQVVVIDNNETHDANGVENEALGVAFCKKLFGENTKWVQTSFNNNMRDFYAGVGDIYDPVKDVFVPQMRGEIGIVVIEKPNNVLEESTND
jgi:hypothetical protein